MRSKRYSESTITTYSEALKSFLIFYREKPVAAITNEDVIIYNNEYILKNKLSAFYQNNYHLSITKSTQYDLGSKTDKTQRRKYNCRLF